MVMMQIAQKTLIYNEQGNSDVPILDAHIVIKHTKGHSFIDVCFMQHRCHQIFKEIKR